MKRFFEHEKSNQSIRKVTPDVFTTFLFWHLILIRALDFGAKIQIWFVNKTQLLFQRVVFWASAQWWWISFQLQSDHHFHLGRSLKNPVWLILLPFVANWRRIYIRRNKQLLIGKIKSVSRKFVSYLTKSLSRLDQCKKVNSCTWVWKKWKFWELKTLYNISKGGFSLVVLFSLK